MYTCAGQVCCLLLVSSGTEEEEEEGFLTGVEDRKNEKICAVGGR